MGDTGYFYLGAVGIFAGNFAPRGWAFCSGQLLPIAQNSALFSILGTMYGGDGRTTFGLPDLRGRVPVGSKTMGTGPGLSPNYQQGIKGGSETNTLTISQMPSHNHGVTVKVADQKAETHRAGGNPLAKNALDVQNNNQTIEMYAENANATYNDGNQLSGVTESHTGGGQAVNNLQPFQAINYVIALQGLFPPRS